MSSSTPEGSPGEERTLGQLVAQASEDLSTIVRSEIALAKAELTDGAKSMGLGVAMFAGAAVFAVFALIYLLHAAAQGIAAAGLPVWAGYLIVGGVLLIAAAVLALVGKRALSKASPTPTKAIAQAKETVAALKSR